MRPSYRSVIASSVSLALCAGLALTAVPPAHAAGPQDDPTAAVTTLFDRLAREFIPQLASSAQLSRQLPTLAITPAESVKLKTAFASALDAGGPLDELADQATLTDLKNYLDGADDVAAGWAFTASQPDDHSVAVGFTHTVTSDAGLDIRDQAGTISLSTGGGIDVTGTLTGSFTLVYDAAGEQAVLTQPVLSIATGADLPAGKVLNAGLGILGVQVVGQDGPDDYSLASSVTTSWANPDNDAAGSLAFDNPETDADPDDGELAAPGAATGIVTAVRTGSLAGSLVATPRSSDLVAGLPTVGTTVTLISDAAGATFETPLVTAVIPDEAKPFLTMTPRDLAASLSQAASAVLGMQDAEDGNLPLMRGSIANAIDAAGGLKLFLADQVPDADPDDDTPGQPKFASLQDMLAALDSAAYSDFGWTLDVLSGSEADATTADAATFDVATSRVNFTIRATRADAGELELNILGAPTTGKGTYRADGLDATGVDFNGPDGTAGAQLAGRRVNAGSSYAIIGEVTDGNSLDITGDGWVGGKPADGTLFSIEAADPRTGAPEFADSLEETTGIAVANADVSTAKVTPEVTVTLPMALDLSPALTYTDTDGTVVRDCDPGDGTAPCPFQQIDDSGLARIITSLPLPADRVLFRRTDRNLLVADASITSEVQIATSSGFLALSIGGDVTMTVPDGEHLQILKFKESGDIAIPAFVEQVQLQAARVDTTGDVFSQELGGTVSAVLDISVDDAPNAFAEDEDTTQVTVTGTVADLANGIDDGDLTVTPEDASRADLLKALNFEPNNPNSLFGGVQAAFQSAGSDLTTMTGGGLDVPIPFVGSSVGQLIGAGASGADGVTYTQVAGSAATETTPLVLATTKLTDGRKTFTDAFIGRQIVIGSTIAVIVERTDHTLSIAPQLNTVPADATPYLVENELLGAMHRLQALTPSSLQKTVAMAEDALGESSDIDFGLVDGGADGPQLRLGLTWERDFTVSRAVALEFGDQELIGAAAGGELSIGVTGTVKLTLLLPLSAAAMLDPIENTRVVKADSGLDLSFKVDANDSYIGASIGPISLDLGRNAEGEKGSFHAGFGVSIGGAAAGDTPAIGDFFSGGFDVGVTSTEECADDVAGNEDVETPAMVVLCADFPVFVNGTSAGPLTVVSELDAAGESLAAVFGGAQTTVTPPPTLQNILDGSGFKFDSLAEGLKQYLFYAETALRTASDDGAMPVIGKDLQAGADFMGKTRTKLDAFLEKYGDPSTVGNATDLLNTKLREELGLTSAVTVTFTCTGTLEPPTVQPVTTTNTVTAEDTTTYVYKVVSEYKDAKGVIHDSIPSESAEVTNGTLSATKANTVGWDKVDVATGYKVLRATKGTTEPVMADFKVVGTVASGATITFTDKLAVAPTTAYVAATVAYARVPGTDCESETPVLQIEGVKVGLTLGQGKVSAAKGCEDDTTDGGKGNCLGGHLPVDLGLPGLSVKTDDPDGGVSGSVGWALDLSIGMSRTRGFYVETDDPNEFEVGASLQLDRSTTAGTPDLKAQLAIIDVDVTKRPKTGTTDEYLPEFVGHFGINIKDGPDVDTDLTLAEMSRLKVRDVIVVSVNAKVDINWHLKASATAALPGVSTDFRLTWSWGTTSATPPTTPVKPSDTGGLKIAFNNVTLNTGDFFGQALAPYFKQVVDAARPLQPIIDTIFTPMPVISDLSKAAGGQAVTIASLGETFNTLPGGAKIKPFLDALKTVKDLLKGVECTETDCGVKIGSFTLLGARAATTTANAATGPSLIDKSPDTYKPDGDATKNINAKDGSGQLKDKVVPRSALVAGLKAGLSIPVIEDPTLLFGLISGGDIPLVEFDSGPLSLGFQFQKSFGPIYAPPPVMMVIGGGASVELRIAAGFDTFGIRQAIETGDGAQVLDSLYFKTVDNNGVPIPVVKFTGYLEAGASVSIGILEVGVVGGIKLTVGFYWNDPNNDGKFRLFEFAAAVANNPICLFNVGGELSLYIKVFVVIGFSPFSVDFDFTLVNIKLLDFNLKPNCTPPPPRLAGTVGATLYLFAGRLGGEGTRGDKAWDAGNKADEAWVVRQVPGYVLDDVTYPPAVEVRGLGLTESFPDEGGTAISTVVLDGRGYEGKLTVSFTGGSAPVENADAPIAFTKKAVVFGGDNDDTIRTGEGDSWVDGGGGADVVTTTDRTDLTQAPDSVEAHVAGGAGGDIITVGNGKDTVSGDGSLVLGPDVSAKPALAPAMPGTTKDPVALIDVATLADPDDLFAINPAGSGKDQIAAGLGRVVLSGNGGDDTIGTANDSPLAEAAGINAAKGGTPELEALYRAKGSVLVGGAGSDVLKSGSATDTVYTGSHHAIGESDPGSGDAATDSNTVNTGIGNDTVYGSNGLDFVTVESLPEQSATVYGGDGPDVLTGGRGSDKLYGGPGNDYVIAAPATVSGPDEVTDVLGGARDVGVLPEAGSSPKLLVGGTGSDHIYGSDGPSTIFGDTTVDACDVQSDPVSAQPGETEVEGDAADLILGGNGVDVVNAGGGGDWVYAGGAADRVCGNRGDDHLYAGDAADLVFGGSGRDQAYGEAGDDQVYGNGGNDGVYGGTGSDRLQGNGGSDWVDGGTEADVVLGGTSKAGSPDAGDWLFGAAGEDIVIGDNAQSDVAADAPYPTDLGSSEAAIGGNDYLVGGDDADRVYGGLFDDAVLGGNGDDHAEGNPGSDWIFGEAGDDDLIGGSSELATGLFSGTEAGRPDADDVLSGGAGQDVIAGDNAAVTRGGAAHPQTIGRGLVTTRGIDLADETSAPAAGRFGGDRIEGGGDTDLVFGQRGDDEISLGDGADYGEGGQGADVVRGDEGDDDVLGGSFTSLAGTHPTVTGQPDGGDTLTGDAGQDVVLGDNGALTRPVAPEVGSPLTLNRVSAQRAITPYDLGDLPVSGTSGADTITGGLHEDVLLGQGGADKVDGDSEADYVEGGQGSDLVLGGTQDDDLVGGSSAVSSTVPTGGVGQPDGADNILGGAGSDLVLGDNGLLTRPASGRDWRTNRLDDTGTTLVPAREVAMHDLAGPIPAAANAYHSAGDAISGQDGVDVIFGQDGTDTISGGSDDDYVEGDGASDAVHGDVALKATELVAAPPGAAWTTPSVDGDAVQPGQDDLVGGWARQGYRDGDDTIHGDGGDDFVVADNGSIARVLDGTVERVYAPRYGALRTGSAKVRVAGGGAVSTRFCPATGATATSTCEVAGAFGSDAVFGDGGQDVLYGQDGADTIRGGDGDDDIYGELGADVLFGEDGEDAILGDRGGIQDRYEDGSRSTTSTLTMPPAVSFTSRLNGTLSREVDLLHDVNGTDFVGAAKSAPMALDGVTFGGADRIRGGNGHDSIHAGAGNDLVNGDTGGDAVFGDRGSDVLWGGGGKECAATDAACQADAGVNGEFIDHLAGGKDDDVIDWRPRGVYGTGATFTGRTCSTGTAPVTTKKDGTTDPCSWFEMTGRADDVLTSPATLENNQHHQGVDWVYGGWDRDVMQGDLANNGPNNGDRLIDWDGVYNLWSHCTAAYGGFTDVRVPAPAVQSFLIDWAAGNGAGRPAAGGVSADAATSGTAAFDELGLVYNGDLKAHGAGKAYPTTPGHFDDANACSGP